MAGVVKGKGQHRTWEQCEQAMQKSPHDRSHGPSFFFLAKKLWVQGDVCADENKT